MLIWIPILLYTAPTYTNELSAEKVFTNIYQKGLWGGPYFSGGGSTLKNAQPYIVFLQNFIDKHAITSVVDLGCGDWQFSQYINWNNSIYYGYDVVSEIIERNIRRFAKNNIHFIVSDGITDDLPCADLLICKDVLQHLTNSDIMNIIKQFPKYRYCLIINDMLEPHQLHNKDIARGSCRRLDLSKPPFSLSGTYIFSWLSEGYPKTVFYIERS